MDIKPGRDVFGRNERAAKPQDLDRSILGDMLDDGLSGRMERRLPLIVVLRLEPAQGVDTDEQEKTYTDNISPRGARVFSKHLWQAGEVAKLTPLHEGSICGQVVYCQKLPDERYAIGLHILNRPIPWPIIRRFWPD